ncbi:MAG: hypothetical protein QW209_06330 [Nitrososphaerota archaeon]
MSEIDQVNVSIRMFKTLLAEFTLNEIVCALPFLIALISMHTDDPKDFIENLFRIINHLVGRVENAVD